MKLYFTLSRRYLFVICMLLVVLLLVFSRVSQAKHIAKNAKTNELRVEYIASLGYSVNETAVYVKNTEIPYEFSPEFEEYNEEQKQIGFDLAAYKGCRATVYSYEIKEPHQNGKEFVTIIVYKDRVIGTDVYKSQI